MPLPRDVGCGRSRRICSLSTPAVIGRSTAARLKRALIVPSPHLDGRRPDGVWVSDPDGTSWSFTPPTAAETVVGKESFAIDGFSGCATRPILRFCRRQVRDHGKGSAASKIYRATAADFECVMSGQRGFSQRMCGDHVAATPPAHIRARPRSKSVRVFVRRELNRESAKAGKRER